MARIAPRPKASRQPRAGSTRVGSEGNGQQRTTRSADPEGAVDGHVDASAVLGRYQFIDRGVDRCIFTADAGSGQEARAKYRVSENAVSTVATV